jgi:FtsP/CotA-like multicopper oxidase with cupredoxin domain
MSRAKVFAGAVAFAAAVAVPGWFVPTSAADTSRATAAVAAPQGHATSDSGMPAPASGGSSDWQAMDARMAKRDKSFPAATKGVGAQVLTPTVLPDGTKEFHLTAEVARWEIEPGKVVDAWTYNGMVPGPTFHLNVGDKVRIVVRNNLPESTSIHWHGIQVPNDQDGVSDITQDPIKPGTTYTYAFRATRQMVGWYHSHHDGTKQVTSGLFGAFIIGELPLPRGVHVSQEVPFELQDAGTIGMTINGKSFPATAPVRAHLGDWIEIHYVNAGTQSHPMHLHGLDQLVIAKDGFPLPQPYRADTVPVAPGERYTVLVHADAPGHWAFHCHIFPHSEGAQGMFGLFTEMIVS